MPPGETQINDICLTPSGYGLFSAAADKVRCTFCTDPNPQYRNSIQLRIFSTEIQCSYGSSVQKPVSSYRSGPMNKSINQCFRFVFGTCESSTRSGSCRGVTRPLSCVQLPVLPSTRDLIILKPVVVVLFFVVVVVVLFFAPVVVVSCILNFYTGFRNTTSLSL